MIPADVRALRQQKYGAYVNSTVPSDSKSVLAKPPTIQPPLDLQKTKELGRIIRPPDQSAESAVLGNQNLKQKIMSYVETPYCAEATNRGKRCARAWTYRNNAPTAAATHDPKNPSYVPQRYRELDCRQYCGERCNQWLAEALLTAPTIVYFATEDDRPIESWTTQSWTITLLINDTEMQKFVAKFELAKLWRLLGYANEWKWYLAQDIDYFNPISATTLSETICRHLSEPYAKIRISTNFPSNTSTLIESDASLHREMETAKVRFGLPKSEGDTWIRPNKMWEVIVKPWSRSEIRTTLTSWRADENEVAAPSSGGTNKTAALLPRYQPSIISRLF